MTPDPTLLRPTPHHIIWTWQAPVADWLGARFRPWRDTMLPFLILGEEEEETPGAPGLATRLTPLNLIHGLALAGGEGPVPGDTGPQDAQRAAFSLLAKGIGRTPEQALLDVAGQLGEIMGELVRIRVLRNAPGLGVRGSLVSCALAFALYRHREQFPADRQAALAEELVGLWGQVIMDDLHPAAREHLLDILRAARERLRTERALGEEGWAQA